jgi:carbonic anhydrase/acetyltransferase-like protein (isoleucine patch superfamily)
MLKIILQEPKFIHPFNEAARDLRILNKPLWLHQRDVLAPYVSREKEIEPGKPLPDDKVECLVYRDNLYFDTAFIDLFISKARQLNRPCRVAFSIKDAAFREHALPLATSYTRVRADTPDDDIYLADLWYYPQGIEKNAEPLLIDLQSQEAGYYHIPTYMASDQGDLVFQVPLYSIIAIDSWVHIFIADVVFGLFGRAVRTQKRLDDDLLFKLEVLWRSLYEGKQLLTSSKLITVGRNCTIHPGAMIFGPTTIGDNVNIDAGAVIENSIIGDNCNISQGCQIMLSVVGDGAFLPFRASLFMTSFMDNSMVAQNTCLQMCVIGRNTFIGAGSTFTDFNLLPSRLKAMNGRGELADANREVLGGCVGHNCRLGSGMIIFPARTIESDVVLFASPERRVIQKNIRYEDSDHHTLAFSNLHQRLYDPHRQDEVGNDTW